MLCRALPLILALAALILATAQLSAAEADAASIQIDADYPGGNLGPYEVKGDEVDIAQDIRDTSTWWFYYNFRVRGAGGRELTFHWTNKNPMAARGPAVSTDGGKNWQWLGKETVRGDSFVYRFPEDAEEVRFCLGMPYQLADLQRFIERHKKNPHLKSALHATSEKGRPVHRLHVGQLEAEPKYRIVLTARHHACEMMASYTLEGFMEAMLADTDEGHWFRENVELLAVPMMDLDGVEDGDQGKNRDPHDHNRDYRGEGTPRYASVRANKELVPQWSEGKLKILLDLHCPWVRGGGENPGSNERIYFVGGPNEELWQNTTKLAMMLESMQSGPLPYQVKHNLPHGVSWNTAASNLNRSFRQWAVELPGVSVASTIEIPYATVGEVPVTQQSARALGHDLAHAMRRYLMSLDE
ncbi:MAG: M14 family zinc carboxypeptidase [Pirellulaceae bacterium]